MEKDITVVKFGSEIVCGKEGIDQSLIDSYVDGLIQTYDTQGLVVVTSGAVRTGKALLTERGVELEAFTEPTLAQIGNTAVMHAWYSAFEKHGVIAGGLLVTHHEIEDHEEGPIFVDTINKGVEAGIVSVVNANDPVSREELDNFEWGGDNDRLSVYIAKAVGARTLGIFTKIGGVIDDDGDLIEEIGPHNHDKITEMLLMRSSRGLADDDQGRGGIVSKFQSAYDAFLDGIATFIAAPNQDMTGDNVTRFV